MVTINSEHDPEQYGEELYELINNLKRQICDCNEKDGWS